MERLQRGARLVEDSRLWNKELRLERQKEGTGQGNNQLRVTIGKLALTEGGRFGGRTQDRRAGLETCCNDPEPVRRSGSSTEGQMRAGTREKDRGTPAGPGLPYAKRENPKEEQAGTRGAAMSPPHGSGSRGARVSHSAAVPVAP